MQMNRTKYQILIEAFFVEKLQTIQLCLLSLQLWHKLDFNQKPGIYNKLQNLNAGALMGFERVGAKLYCSPYDLTPKTIYEITFLKILGVNNFFSWKVKLL